MNFDILLVLLLLTTSTLLLLRLAWRTWSAWRRRPSSGCCGKCECKRHTRE